MTPRQSREGASDPLPAALQSPEMLPSGGPGGRHLSRRAGLGPLRITAFVMAAVLMAAVAFVAVHLYLLQSNISTMPLNLGENQESGLPVDSSNDPLQILILGTDTRLGNSGEFFGGEEESSGQGNSDVMMLMTLSADRENVNVVSFPRDLLVPLPSCVNPGTGELSDAAQLAQLNEALHEGGPGCTVAAINDLTGMTVDHFMMADFNAVKELSSTLGGVEVCVDAAVEDEYSGLSLPAGTSEVEGDQALAFLRTRHGFGDGGDTGRIAAQQSFLASMARKVRSEGTLTNIPKLYDIADTVTRNLTIDEGLARPTELLKIADRLRDVDLGRIAFVTVPNAPWDQDPNRLVLDEEPAEDLFETLREDRSLVAEAPEPPEPSASAPDGDTTPAPATPDVPAVDPSTIPVLVINATSDPDRAAELQEILADAGYTQTTPYPSAPVDTTQVIFGEGYETVAQDLATQLGVPEGQLFANSEVQGIQLLIGADLATGDRVVVPPLGTDLRGQTAEQVTCQAVSGF